MLCVIGGVHGTEYAAHDAVVTFWERIEPQQLNGEVRVVLAADVTAMVAHSAYINPVDGKNLNRVWPGDPDGSLTERIASAITTNCVEGSDAVIDVHGGEWDEDIDCFIITHRVGDADLDKRTVDLAMALGFTYVEVTDSRGEVLGRGTGAAEAMKGGRPAMTLEAGGTGRRDHRYVMAHVHALENAMRYLGILEGSPILFDGASVLLDHGCSSRRRPKAGTCPRSRSVTGSRPESCSPRWSTTKAPCSSRSGRQRRERCSMSSSPG